MVEISDLTPGMKKALWYCGFGVRKYRNGYRSVEDATKVDGRSLQALWVRGLIEYDVVGGCAPQIHLELTERGDELFEELRANGYNA